MFKNKKVKPVPQKEEEIIIPATQSDNITLTEEIEYSIDDTQFTSQTPSPIYNSPISGTVIRINTTKQTIIIEDSFHNGIELPITPLNKHNKIGTPYTETNVYSQTEEV